MNVQAMGNRAAGRAAELANEAAANAAQAKQAGKQNKAEPEAAAGVEKMPGVVRLLQEGHFKGVADVRLRINFHEQLTALEQGNVDAAAAEAVPKLAGAVNAKLDELLASGELTEEQAVLVTDAQVAFTSAMDDLASGGQGRDALIAGVQQAFQGLFESLQPLIPAPAPEEMSPIAELPVEEEGGAPPLAEPETPESVLQGYLDGIKGAFDSALTEFESAFANTGLPPLSEPSGNGVAYAKFLAMYQAMQTTGTGGVTEAPSVDATA